MENVLSHPPNKYTKKSIEWNERLQKANVKKTMASAPKKRNISIHSEAKKI
jgi:hypothetical protein